jgi:hypothetical protein
MNAVYYNADKDTSAVHKLSSKAISLLIPMWLNINDDNLLNRGRFQKKVARIKDYRSWNKYWAELVECDVVIFLDKNIIMVSPHECYRDGVCQNRLITKWNEAHNAIN